MLLKINNQIINTAHIALAELKHQNNEDILWLYFSAAQPNMPNVLWKNEPARTIWDVLCKQSQEVALPSSEQS